MSGRIASRRRLRQAAGLVEVLVAGIILSVCVAAIVSVFYFGFQVTQHSDDKSVGYNIARLELERIRVEGFDNAVIVRDGVGVITSRGLDGTETLYYDSTGAKLATSSGAFYSVTVVITSDKLDTVSGGGQRPADDALRTVIVTVRRISDSSVVHKDGTSIARSGV